jgi:hypothetical protein
MRFSKYGMVNLKPLKIAIKFGNAEDIYSEAIGTFKGLVTQKDGSTFNITLEDILCIPRSICQPILYDTCFEE